MLLYRFAKSNKSSELLPLVGFMLIGLVASVYQGANPALFISIIVVFDSVAFTYGSNDGPTAIVLGFFYFLLCLLTLPIAIVAQAMLFGMLSETKSLYSGRPGKTDRRLETSRDIFQILLGLVIISLFYLTTKLDAEIFAILLILLGYLVVDYVHVAKKGKLSKKMMEYEREYTKFGEGAIFLALGTLMVIGFLSNSAYIVTILIAIFIADSLATIAGVNFSSPKLPYNNGKSILGLVVYFIAVSAIGYFFVGKVVFVIALLGAIVESLPIKVDDNFSVPLVLVILTRILTS